MKHLDKKIILLTGGAGYIGSHTAYLLHQQGYRVIIIDNCGHQQSFNPSWATCITADIAAPGALESIFQTYSIDAVMHFAGFIEVGESVKHPDIFYDNNVIKTHHLLTTMLKHNVSTLIFSSTCAIYGAPQYLPMDEAHPLTPLSPYGKTKLAIEFMLQDYAHAFGLKYGALRYFNAAGALPKQGLGERHNPETHLIPLLLQAIKNDKPFTIFGDDYQTADGTCIRDYVHVLDIARAHILALHYLQAGNTSNAFNVGTGTGYSVLEIIRAAERIGGKKLTTKTTSRRQGDAAILVANAQKIGNVLGWKPESSDLETIISSAWHCA